LARLVQGEAVSTYEGLSVFTRNPAPRRGPAKAHGSILSTWRAANGRATWIQKAIATLSGIEGVDRVGIWLDPDVRSEDHTNPVVFRGVVWGKGDENLPLEWTRLSLEGLLKQDALRLGQSVEYQNESEGCDRILGPFVGLQSALLVPINGQELLRGFILVGSKDTHAPIPKAEAELVAGELALLLEFEDQNRIAKHRASDLKLWQRIQSALGAETNFDPLLKELVENCTRDESDDGIGVVFALIGELRSSVLTVKGAATTTEEGLIVLAQSGDNAWGHSVTQGPLETLWRQTIATGRLMGAEANRLPLAKDISRIVSIPLQWRGETFGVMMAGLPRSHDSLEVLARLELRATLAVQLLELQRRGVKELREKSWQRAILDSSSESLFLIERNGVVEGLSKAAKEFLQQHGKLPLDFEAKNRFAELFRPRDWEEIQRWVMHSSSEKGLIQGEPLAAQLRSGKVVHLWATELSENEFLAVRMESAEHPGHSRSLEEVHAELFQTLEWLQEGVLIVDECGEIRSMNTRCQQMLGISSKQVVHLRNIEELISLVSANAVNPESFAANWRQLSTEGSTETQEELNMNLPAPQVIERCTRPIVDGHGKKLGRVEVYQEVTARRMFQSRMLQAEKLASLGQRAIGIVHELSNPLTTILGNAQRMMLRNSDARENSELIRILQESERASNIVRQLLYLSRETSPPRRPVHLRELVERTAELQRPSLAGSKINLRLDLKNSLPPIDGDFAQLQQALLNLLQNAQQAIEQSGKGSTVGVRTEQPDEDHVRLEVWDDGPGIPEAIQSRIYDPFFTTKPSGEGTGLGLSVALGFIRQHGGAMKLVSAPEGGAHFVIEFPRAKELPPLDRLRSHKSDVEPSIVQSKVNSPWPPSDSRAAQAHQPVARILVVEDEPTVAALIGDVLREEGMHVDVLLDSQSALRQTDQQSYDLLICDLKMPGMDGQMLHRALLERSHPLCEHVLFVTGDMLAPHSHDFLERYHLPHLAKPFRMEELGAAVHKLLGKKRVTGNFQPELTSRHVSGNG
jgi:signal transduction histidine kinase/CheY-like chemotaxis protein